LSLPAGFGVNLARRVATAVVALPLLGAAFFLGPPFLGVAVVAAAALVGLLEFFRFAEQRQLRPMRITGFLLASAMFLDVVHRPWRDTPVWPLAAVLLLGVTLFPGRDLIDRVPSAAVTLLGAVYIGALGGTIASLRTMAPLGAGPWRVALLFGIIMASDTLAFFAGLLFGRHHLAPALSPSKTVEGAVGGLAGGVLGAFLVRGIGLPSLPPLHTLALGLLVALFGIVGDLDESLLKRWAGVKDSGTLFPGHGGMLDRLDSLLFGAPILYYYFVYVR
jgi:phosphatidate cytidylyltransferase